MINWLEERNKQSAFKWRLRVGLHTGPVVAGVVGTKRYAFDIWGDTVNIASRMESSGEIGRVNISAYTYDLIREIYDCEYRGKVFAKGKGEMDMYFVKGEKSRLHDQS
jgi:class 3 adenylate cyclase